MGFDDGLAVDSNALWGACTGMREKFPHVDGLEGSSAFKKVANFVVYFVAEKPIKADRVQVKVGDEVLKLDLNAVIALEIAVFCLNNSEIAGANGSQRVDNGLYLSDHSYFDIIWTLSSGITPQSHYHLLALYFEQLTYKCNPDLEYKVRNYCPGGEAGSAALAKAAS